MTAHLKYSLAAPVVWVLGLLGGLLVPLDRVEAQEFEISMGISTLNGTGYYLLVGMAEGASDGYVAGEETSRAGAVHHRRAAVERCFRGRRLLLPPRDARASGRQRQQMSRQPGARHDQSARRAFGD